MQGQRKGRRTANEERKLMDLLGKSYDYLNTNFTKFDPKTRVHIALELIKKRVPMEIKHSGEVDHKHTVEVVDLDERIGLLTGDRICSAQN
jgi:hypothetical protein